MGVMTAAQRYAILGALMLIPVGVVIAGYPYSKKIYNTAFTFLGFAIGISAALIVGYVLFSTGG